MLQTTSDSRSTKHVLRDGSENETKETFTRLVFEFFPTGVKVKLYLKNKSNNDYEVSNFYLI